MNVFITSSALSPWQLPQQQGWVYRYGDQVDDDDDDDDASQCLGC